MEKLYDVLKKYQSLTYHQEYYINDHITMQFTNTYTYVELDRYGHLILTSNSGDSVCVLDSLLNFSIEELPFNRDLITITDHQNNIYTFNAKKI